MKPLNRQQVETPERPVRILQFGEGNFLRAFADWIVYNMNLKTGFNGNCAVVQPIANGMIDVLKSQDGLYHLNLQGLSEGKQVDTIEQIDVISQLVNPYTHFSDYLKLAENPDLRFIVSNTTEAGIVFDPTCKPEDAPASSYPGKLTQLLFHRFIHFKADSRKGLIIFPCELIFHNGTALKKCIRQYIEYWKLGKDFSEWFENACGVYSTLVDRIVPGYPKENAAEIIQRIGFEDKLLVKAEIFHLWVIEAPAEIAAEFPADQAGLNVLFVPSEKPYHDRKVTLLNGPHTVLSPLGYLSGLDTVREIVEHETTGQFVRKVIFDELLQTLDLPQKELEEFANAVLERFRNPFVKHFVTSIMLNSFPKYKTRDLPGLKTYLQRKGTLPEGLVLGLAGIITYYKGGVRGTDPVIPNDDPAILNLLTELWNTGSTEKVAKGVLAAEFIWGEDLNQIPALTDKITTQLDAIQKYGMLETIKRIL